ncbi:MAG: NAD(P)/FAD-dependent oxidoreductase [Gracilibacteraceae bacterium]|jgi:NADPH-dependent 2,4-dienoyl-CoA reductase/sulfur reductase-like enzyme|nr:NAD(P)/FAD-dependent oxidoreductase [Gracilibacteraceae bacterium]
MKKGALVRPDVAIIRPDVAIIGAGPAGLAAAAGARAAGAERVLVLEREERPGGILNQCIHDGFGLVRFGETLTGPEYAGRFLRAARESGAEILTRTMVLGLTPERRLQALGPRGYMTIEAGAVILATGCRERTRGAVRIPGSRPAGIFTAGVAQYYLNRQNIMVGRRALILGSGDVGLIMARRLTLEGGQVPVVVEKLPYPGGLARNIAQCLDDYNIPLRLSHTVTRIEGEQRVERAAVARLDAEGREIPGTEQVYDCDTIILSVGLIPENELALKAGVHLSSVTGGPLVDDAWQTNIPGIFACGNSLHVHDLVDYASAEAENAARAAVAFSRAGGAGEPGLPVRPGAGVRYVLPFSVRVGTRPLLSLRVSEPTGRRRLVARAGGRTLAERVFPRLAPAEMVRLELREAVPPGAKALEVLVTDA